MTRYFVVPFLGVGLVMAVSNQQSVAQPPTPPAAPAGAAAQPALPPMRIDRLEAGRGLRGLRYMLRVLAGTFKDI